MQAAMSFYSHVVQVQQFSALSCGPAGIIILLPLSLCYLWCWSQLEMTSMAACLSVPQVCLMANCGLLLLIASLRIHHLAMSVEFLLLSYIIQSSLSKHGCMMLMVMHMHRNCSSLFVSWLCLDNQSAMNNCDPGLYSVLMLYWCIPSRVVFFKACVIGLQDLSWILLPVTCDL